MGPFKFIQRSIIMQRCKRICLFTVILNEIPMLIIYYIIAIPRRDTVTVVVKSGNSWYVYLSVIFK